MAEEQGVGQRRRKEIRQAAKSCFLRKGYQFTTMGDVVKEVGMSRGGVYHHYSSTKEMLKDLMEDGNQYRKHLISQYLEKNQGRDGFEQMAEILVDKALATTDLMRLYTELLQAKNQDPDLEALFQELKEASTQELGMIARQLGIGIDLFQDGFLVNYINSLILSTQVLGARQSFLDHRAYLKETMKAYMLDLEGRVKK